MANAFISRPRATIALKNCDARYREDYQKTCASLNNQYFQNLAII